MYKYKEKKLPDAIMNMIDEVTKKHGQKTRIQETSKLYINPFLDQGDTLYEMISQWNNNDLEIKMKSYGTKSVKERINHHFRQKYISKCEKANCYSCQNTIFDETQLIPYMKR